MGAARARSGLVTPSDGAAGGPEPSEHPSVAAWERDAGLRWGERIAMTIAVDRRSGVCPHRTAAALTPLLRQMTLGQLGLAARALERMAAAERGRPGASGV